MVNKTIQASISQSALLAIAAAFVAAILCAGMPQAALAAQDAQGVTAGTVASSTQAKPAIINETLWAGSKVASNLQILNFPASAKVTKVTSSKPAVLKVAKARYSDGSSYWDWVYKPLKAGASTVRVTYKQGSATKTIQATIKVKKYPTVFKSITLDGKKLALPKKSSTKRECAVFSYAGTKPVIRITPAKGWKVNNVWADAAKTGSNKFAELKVANGKAFKLAKNKWALYGVAMENAAGDLFYYNIRLVRTAPVALKNVVTYVGESKHAQLTYADADVYDAKIASVSSSNKGVLAVAKGSSDIANFWTDAKKVGTSKVTLKYKLDGKAYVASAMYTVKNYPNAVKSLQVNGARVSLKDYKFSYFLDSYKKDSVKVNLVPAAGWKISSVKAVSSKNGYAETKVGNNASIAIAAGGTLTLDYELKNSATGDAFTYSVYVQR